MIRPFLEWLFEQHDTDKNGYLVYEEFRKAQFDESKRKDSPYAFWPRYAPIALYYPLPNIGTWTRGALDQLALVLS